MRVAVIAKAVTGVQRQRACVVRLGVEHRAGQARRAQRGKQRDEQAVGDAAAAMLGSRPPAKNLS
jgi:hypothetical protein